MKINQIKTSILSFVVVIVFICFGCNKEDNNTDVTPPGQVTNITYKPTSGGAVIYYTAPVDADLLYVKASYINSLGKEVFKVASRYNDSIEIDGFSDENPHDIKISAVDYKDNVSKSSTINITPLKSYIYTAQETMKIKEDFGGVRLYWDNPTGKNIFIYIYYKTGDKVTEIIRSSNKTSERITEMDAIPYDISIAVEDFNGNKTNVAQKGTYTPLKEEKIDKSTWSVLQSLSVDGDKYEGSLKSFFDDVIDTKESKADNSYFIIDRSDNGGALKFPLNIVIDLHKNVVVDRFIVWQRAFWYLNEAQGGVSAKYYYYQEANMKSFDVLVSSDLNSWTSLGTFDIGDPKDSNGNIPTDFIIEAIKGHEIVLDSVSPSFRYMKFAILSNYGSEIDVYGSEITLYGLDNLK